MLLLFLAALINASETALMTLNRYRLQQRVKQQQRAARKTYQLLQHPERLLTLILCSKYFINLLAAAVTTLIAIHSGGGYNGLLAAILALTLFMLIAVEAVPKALAARKPERIALPIAYVYSPLSKLLAPLLGLLNGMTYMILKILGIQPPGQYNPLGQQELQSLLAQADYLMPPRYHALLQSVVDLESATVQDIMTPRLEIVGLDIDSPMPALIVQIQHSKHTRLPVYKKTIDRVVGFLHLRTALMLVNQMDFTKETIIQHLLKPVFIPQNTPLNIQIQQFKLQQARIGLVIDEYGDVLGLVTLDDLLQTIIGELSCDDTGIKQHRDGSITVEGSVTIREFNRLTHSELPLEGPKTLNGLIVEQLETIPDIGTWLTLPGYRLEVIARDEHAVKQVRLYPHAISKS